LKVSYCLKHDEGSCRQGIESFSCGSSLLRYPTSVPFRIDCIHSGTALFTLMYCYLFAGRPLFATEHIILPKVLILTATTMYCPTGHALVLTNACTLIAARILTPRRLLPSNTMLHTVWFKCHGVRHTMKWECTFRFCAFHALLSLPLKLAITLCSQDTGIRFINLSISTSSPRPLFPQTPGCVGVYYPEVEPLLIPGRISKKESRETMCILTMLDRTRLWQA
jgi:hypothetical protein